ncbi:MAG: DUF4982 domain-containing protein [Bacteroidaceae bacterium]|nr:DUF4982 domain-containing protein [Bacteroidaceae bacterium]
MNIRLFTLLAAATISASTVLSQRTDQLIRNNWRFHRGDVADAQAPNHNDSEWQSVTIPHDWAITGPFSRDCDLQNVAVTQNGESVASWKTGRTGGLPYTGVGWYRTTFNAPADGRTTLVFDGAMSEAHVYVNGTEAIFWPYGYNSFYVDVTSLLRHDGQPNTLAVRLENREQSSRWYCGAGLYRNVHLVHTADVHVAVWGAQVTTQMLPSGDAAVTVRYTMDNAEGKKLQLLTDIVGANGEVVASKDNTLAIAHGQPFQQNFIVEQPRLWSPEQPNLYRLMTKVYDGDEQVDQYEQVFGIRTIEFIPDRGFFLNGQPRKFQGVCNHHDLGPLGAAVNRAALRRQLTLLKDMGCDAIRTSHNMPAPELVELCDSMGFMMMLEPFDEWDKAKCKNGYHRYFEEWAEKDMVNMLRHYRNSPAVVMWSIGNEVPSQWTPNGYQVASFLQNICHREDPTRPVTCGMDQVSAVLDNGFAALLDIPGFNYRAHRYEEAYSRLPQNIVLGSETSSTVSSRGVYKLPAELKYNALYEDHQSTGYDLEYCSWSNVPDVDFANADDHDWEIGQFVWTGFDYLGEPSPYDTDAWPSHSSLFGIIDLASLPKDRYYLYRSVWNSNAQTLHILPHWTWPDMEGQTVPVFVYTDAPQAELFVNGVSQGVQHKYTKAESDAAKAAGDPFWLLRRYRLMWTDVKYEAGEVKVVTPDGRSATMRTAGRPHHIELIPDRTVLSADGEDLCYVTVRIVDKDGNLIPNAADLVKFNVNGAGIFRAAANGDAANLDLFHLPQHHAFAGQLTAIVQSKSTAGTITLEASAKGLKKGVLSIKTE